MTNRFKRLYLIDRVPAELWMEVCDIVQEAGIKTITKKKKCKKAKWLSEEALQITEKRSQPRQHIKKQRHYFVNKGPSSQNYGFSSSYVWT